MSMTLLKNARVRLLVRHTETEVFVRNAILARGLRDAILQAHAASLDGGHSAFVCVNERVVGLYLRGARSRYAYVDDHGQRVRCEAVELPRSLRTVAMSPREARTKFLPGLEYQEEGRVA